jgi:hypothetical protein
MDPSIFDEIYEKVKPLIEKKNTNMRDAISAHARLCLTLRFLASGASYKELMYEFRISVSSIAKIVPNVCQALYDVLKDEYLRLPTKSEEWKNLAEEFALKWQFPHAVGAIDGKHINIRSPPNSVTEYFNYKKHFSIVHKFITFDLGSPGSQSDSGIFKDGPLSMLCKSAFFPAPSKLGQRITPTSYYLLGDDAFALDVNLMKPYPYRSAMGDEKVFNYRLSRARRIVENAFGLLCARFRLLLRTIELDVANVMQVVRACVALHNFLMTKKDNNYIPSGYMDSEDEVGNMKPGNWRDEVDGNVCNMRNNPSVRPSTVQAREIRDDLKDYFFEEGAIEFQWTMTE